MKLITTLIIFTACISCKSIAQIQGSYTANTTMTVFHGYWQWVSGTDTVRIYFKTSTVVYDMNGGFTWDNLVEWYYYKKGNQLVFSNYNSIGNTALRTLVIGGNENNPQNKVEATFKDPLKDGYNGVVLTLNGTQNLITWRAWEIGHAYNNRPAPTPCMTLPANMVFTKL